MSRWTRLYRRRREALLDKLGRKCVQCGATERLEFDHIEPADWSRRAYSSHERLRLYEQEAACGLLQVLCRQCNAKKGGHQWLQMTFEERGGRGKGAARESDDRAALG